MTLTPMRFKGYVWPHNPRTYGIEYRRRVISHAVPYGVCALQDLGRQHRVLRGEGEFYGQGAYREFQRLASIFYENSPGVLEHPVWMTTRAWFVELGLSQEPTEDYVSYSFEFWECLAEYDPAPRQLAAARRVSEPERTYHAVVWGDTVNAIAAANSLTTAELIALNPQIKNPNLIHPGNKIRVS